MENYIYHCYSCLASSALWTLHFTMYYELYNPKVGVVLPHGGQRARVQYSLINEADTKS